MNSMDDMLTDTTLRLFDTEFPDEVVRSSRAGQFPQQGWTALEEAGLPLGLLSEAEGGFGLATIDALALVRICGAHASPVPLVETMVTNWLRARVGLPLIPGPATFALLGPSLVTEARGRDRVVRGELHNVPWAEHSASLVVVGRDFVVEVPRQEIRILSSSQPGSLPRNTIGLDITLSGDHLRAFPGSLDLDTVRCAGAVMRTLEMAGALEQIVAMTVAYAGDRIQFGRPIGKQQAVQQQIAVLASQAAAANAAATLAAGAFGDSYHMEAVAVGKSRAGEAASVGAAIAHQVHGAIGFTRDYRLHFFTRALWTWRDEYGSERYWNEFLGQRACAGGADQLWSFITRVGTQLPSEST